MAATALVRPRPAARARHRLSVRELGPHWYAGVMGTAIVATAGAAVGLPSAALVPVWALGTVLLAALLAARAVHWTRHADRAREHLADPAVAPFYGCLSMALLAVGAATTAVGARVTGGDAAFAVHAALWVAGTAVGLAAAVAVPYLMVVRHRVRPGDASPVWLLPVVAPMVSAATGPALAPRLPAGQWRESLVMGCFGMFGMSLLATLLMLPLVFARLVERGPLPLALTPALFLVLGPLGQSTTAAGALADGSAAVPGAFAALYGVPVLGFALLWLAVAGALVVRAVRHGMPFALTWWAFTFPVGTCVTGAASLAEHTGLAAFRGLAVLLYGLLVAAWLTAAVRTAAAVARGGLLAAPAR
ncbi:C4-dicarboxylate ABC transporter [Streptomyces sp. WAC 06738]|uniref:TDT family transporter n=1 Tax=Streptomyces sp. WAC 06738 TaxID=2203210 RepID=UPI000F6CF917|nr:TDT family transporter [Streptomyces sp. WAC 06738]AZM45081.1 C4-dicarboxylate ABC transporter [Streptomyces sp. WAC 06738]